MGDRQRPTIITVAARAGVGRTTVSRVINGSELVSEKARAAVLAAIAELNYVPNSIARVVLFRDNLAKPLGGPVTEVCAVAKRDLTAGEILDDYGMYMTYGEATNVDEMSKGRYLPEGLVEGCTLVRDVKKDAVLTYDDVALPQGRLADRLRAEQYRHFRSEHWLEELSAIPA